jgi:hypothetical protein
MGLKGLTCHFFCLQVHSFHFSAARLADSLAALTVVLDITVMSVGFLLWKLEGNLFAVCGGEGAESKNQAGCQVWSRLTCESTLAPLVCLLVHAGALALIAGGCPLWCPEHVSVHIDDQTGKISKQSS